MRGQELSLGLSHSTVCSQGCRFGDSGVVDGESEAFFGVFPYQRELQWHINEMCQQREKK